MRCVRAAKAGVRVRVILDSLGARHVDNDLVEAMGEAGVLSALVPAARARPGGPATAPTARSSSATRTSRSPAASASPTSGTVRAATVRVARDAGPGAGTGRRRSACRVRRRLARRRIHALRRARPVPRAAAGRRDDGDGRAQRVRARLVRRSRCSGTRCSNSPSGASGSPRPTSPRAREMIETLCRTVARGVQVQLLHPGPQTDKEIARAGGRAGLRRPARGRHRVATSSSRRCCTPRC